MVADRPVRWMCALAFVASFLTSPGSIQCRLAIICADIDLQCSDHTVTFVAPSMHCAHIAHRIARESSFLALTPPPLPSPITHHPTLSPLLPRPSSPPLHQLPPSLTPPYGSQAVFKQVGITEDNKTLGVGTNTFSVYYKNL
jgi:hypothetical protein